MSKKVNYLHKTSDKIFREIREMYMINNFDLFSLLRPFQIYYMIQNSQYNNETMRVIRNEKLSFRVSGIENN